MNTTEYLDDCRKIFRQYKSLGEKAMAQVDDQRLFWCFHNDSNSIAMIVQHISGNMLSRFTNFFTEDGEKSWRHRDNEFEPVLTTRIEMMEAWDNGWNLLLPLLDNLTEADLERTVYIRSEPHSVLKAIQRQLAHYSYHIGQIVFLSKMVAVDWQSLSIPKNKSEDFNKEKFGTKP
ncbi:MAG: DUF1572 family protein [Flavobacteriales bacterium]|nr:DUF1572 family protein [Flavobacteriales bacterium]